MAGSYAHPEVLVETDWVAQHLEDPQVRLVESDEDYLLYEQGHIPGAVKIDWFSTLQDPVRRDFISREEFERMCSRLGIANTTNVVFYGDKNNWFATYAFWLFEYYGHRDMRVMNGGRAKWIKENRPLSREVPSYPPTQYTAQPPENGIRAFREQVLLHSQSRSPLVDVRSPQEYSGELLAMPNYPQEGAMRGGHVPGAVNIPWSQAVDAETSLFKAPEALQKLYGDRGVTPENEIITYCRIGERSSHTWFVLKYLLGYPMVKNYDGSWTEWGNLVGAPIHKGDQP